jgi:trypsin-like peptidase
MKRLLTVALLFLLTGLSMSADAIRAPRGFAGTLYKGTLALYGTLNKDTRFLCTATPYEKIKGGYHLITAGHCVQLMFESTVFSVADDIGLTQMPVTVVKVRMEDNIDFAEFELKTTKKYSVVSLGDEWGSAIGDKTINVNFALGIEKQVSHGQIASKDITATKACPAECIGDFLVQESGSHGSSGSAVVAEKTRQVIGIVIYGWDGSNIGVGVEPISRFYKFLQMPTQAHPKAETAEDETPTSLKIPDEAFKNLFGIDHTFMLTVPGPNPKFVRAGYSFQVLTYGYELSDDYYYLVPVAITIADDGQYRLTSTKDGVSVPVVVTEVPK